MTGNKTATEGFVHGREFFPQRRLVVTIAFI